MSFLVRTRARARTAQWLGCPVFAFAVAACSTTSTSIIAPVEVAYDSNGAPRILAARWVVHNYFIEGTAGPFDLAFAERSSDGTWLQATRAGDFGQSLDVNPGHIARSTNGRDYLVTHQSNRPIAMNTRTTGAWTPTFVAPSVPAAAIESPIESVGVTDIVNTGWLGTDGLTRFVVGRSLLEFEADQLIRAIPIPRDLSRTILRRRSADVTPTGDRSAELTLFESIGGSQVRAHLGSLQCTETDCVVTDRTSEDFIAIGGPREIGNATTFHLVDGTAVQACTFAPFAGGHIDIEVSSPGRERVLISDAELVGAGPRPDGGFVVVTRPPEANGDPVVLFAIDGAGSERRIRIGAYSVDHHFSFGIAPSSNDVFDVFEASGNTVTRIRVDAGTGGMTREAVELQ